MTITRAEAEAADYSDIATGERLAPVSPGDVLRHDFMEPLRLSTEDVSKMSGIDEIEICGILTGSRSIMPECALGLARAFDTSAEFWMRLQIAHDYETDDPVVIDAVLSQKPE